MPEPHQSHITINGLQLALYEWPGQGRPLLFAHANGMHARCWDQVIALLPGRHCYALDLRGHGSSAAPAPPYDWRDFGADLAALAQALGLQNAVGIGHSLGGHAMALAAARRPAAFGALLLIEPVILPRAYYQAPPLTEHFAARRRDRWESPEQMLARFRDRAPFNRWQPHVLRDYCAHALRPAPDGDGMQLACRPALEAAIYIASAQADIYDEIAGVAIPVRVLRAGTQQASSPLDLSGSSTAPDLASHFPHGQDYHFPQYSHFIPMEDPALIATTLCELADAT